jgi:hypothetical protein
MSMLRSDRTRLLLVLFIAILPNLVWITTDQAAWPWDQAWYAKASVDLFFTLLYVPSEWIPMMLRLFGRQAPGIAWAGQFFVPIGMLVGSIDIGLMLSIVATQAITLLLVASALWHLSGRVLIAIAGLVMLASAALMVALSHYYLVEMMQAMAVAWFIFIMVRAPHWTRPFIATQLVLATTVAMLAKVSSPLFCFGPGLVAVYYLIRGGVKDAGPSGRQTAAWLVLAVPLTIGTTLWYVRNLAHVVAHVRMASTGSVSELYGKSEEFLLTLEFWLGAIYANFFSPLTLVVAIGIVGAGLVMAFVRRDPGERPFLLATGVSVIQLAVGLGIFSLSSNRDDRYALALLPYIAVIICWALARIDRTAIAVVVMAAFGLQWASVHAQALALRPLTSRAPWLNPRTTDPTQKAIVDGIVRRTCGELDSGTYWNTIGVQLMWLNAPGVSYAASKQLAPSSRLRCDFDAVAYYDTNEEVAWNNLMAKNLRYYVSMRTGSYEIPMTGAGQTTNALNERILQRAERSGLFQLEAPLAEHPGILLLKRVDRVDHLAHGRALSDSGNHPEAIAELSKAAAITPENPEAWANLALAYERAGDMTQAITAGERARRLSPTHYYVNLGLARAFVAQKQFGAAVERAEDAALNAPGPTERVNALTLGARSAFETKESARGCTLLRRAVDLQASRELVDELAKHSCAR